jgi:hypothetical protein
MRNSTGVAVNDANYTLNNTMRVGGRDCDSGSIHVYLMMYVSPVIFTLGLIGNMLTIFIMRRPRFQDSTTAVYMPFIATFDTLTLFSEVLPNWVEACGFGKFEEIHFVTCKTIKFLAYTNGDTAIWALVAFNFDRFVAVCFPLKKRVVCTHRHAVIISVVLFIFAIMKNLHVFVTRGQVLEKDDPSNCGKPEPWRYFEKFVRPWMAFALVNVLPFLIILFCNAMIVTSLLRNSGLEPATMPNTRRASNARRASNVSPRRASIATNTRLLSQMTVMCLSISVAFLILLAPSIVLLIGKPYWKPDCRPYKNVKAVASLMMYVHHSCNFFLYCLTGSAFREELVDLFKKGPQERRSSVFDSNASKYTVSSTTSRSSSPVMHKPRKKAVSELA